MARLTQEEREDLTREESLAEAYSLARSHLPRAKRYRYLAWAVGATTTAAALWTGALAKTLGDRVREWSSLGFQFAYGVLGILIAGFAIYTAVALSDLAPGLAKAKNQKSNLSEMKTLALHFIELFVPFLAFIALHFAVMFVGWEGGPAAKLSGLIGGALGFDAQRAGASLVMGVIAGALVYLATCLWVFVFNVYASFMMMARAKVTLTTKRAETTPSIPAEVLGLATAGPPSLSADAHDVHARVAGAQRTVDETLEDDDDPEREPPRQRQR